MDVGQKKIEVKEEIALGPQNVVFTRINICDEIQLADLMKVQFTSFYRQAANTSHSNTDTLHGVCINLAKQRALLHGANVGTIMCFNIGGLTAASGSFNTSIYTSTGTLTFSELENSSYSDNTTLPFIVLHDFNEVGGQVTLSTTPNANTTIADDEGNNIKYFTDFSKYFLTRSRANGELISIDLNSTPYSSPTAAKPFLPANTINGETFFTPPTPDPTANLDIRYEYSLVANSEPIAGGHVGGGYDLAEDYYTGNTFVVMGATSIDGTFTASETITDFANNTATVKSSANTSTVLLETFDAKGTFVSGEKITDQVTNAVVFSTQTVSNTEINMTLTGSTFITGSNTDTSLGFSLSNSIALDINAVSRTGSTVTVIANSHNINTGERIILKGADDAFDEFNGVFIVQDTTANTLTFSTANTGTTNPTGSFSLVKDIIFGRTSNAAAAVRLRTVNASANIVFQSSNLSVGFAVGNTFTGSSSGATGTVDVRTISGAWYQSRTKEVKVFNSGTGEWTLDTAANAGEFWVKELEPVRISTIVPTSGTGSSTLAAKMILTKALATSGDSSGGYDSEVTTTLPPIYGAYPLKTWADQVHDGVVTLEAYDNFASVVIAPEGLELNLNWLPLSQNAGGNKTGADISQNGSVANTAHHVHEVTTLDKSEFAGKLGPYTTAIASPADDVFRSVNVDLRSSAIKVGTTGAVYPLANANPFYPSVGGTHKPIANTADGITGTQPGGLDANSIYAGAYSEYQKGAIEPPVAQSPQTTYADYRYVIQNDQKWIYASNVYDANSGATTAGNFNTPFATDQKNAKFSGNLDSQFGGVAAESATGPGTSTGSTAGTAVGNQLGRNNAGSCNSGTGPSSPANNKKTFTVGSQNCGGTTYSSILRLLEQACVETGGSCSVTAGNASQSVCEGAPHNGIWTPTYGFDPAATNAEVPCAYNRVQQLLTASGANISVGSASGMEPNMAILYTLLLNLTSAAYGKNYTDPVERTEAASYSEVGRNDATFKKETEDMKKAIDDLIVAHGTYKTAIASTHSFDNYFSRNTGTNGKTYLQCITGSTAGTDGVKSVNAELTSYRLAIKYRIKEISNRIGYLNGKDTGNAGTGVSGDVTVGAAGSGFTGYSFNGGNGYANTIFSHANFLAGKKIKLLEKILTAIADVDTIYEQIQSKRSEYYEYNQ